MWLAGNSCANADPLIGVKGYRFEAPKGWVVKQNLAGHDVLALDPTPASLPTTITLSLTLLSEKDMANTTLRQRIDASLADLRQGMPRFKMLGQTETTLAGEKAISCEATYDAEGTAATAKLHQIYAVHGNLQYVVTLITDASQAAKNEALFAQALATFTYGSLGGAPFTSNDGYRATPPPSWTVYPVPGKHSVYFVEQGARDFGANINIAVTGSMPDGYTAEKLYDQREKLNASRYPPSGGFKVLAQAISLVGGDKALDTTLYSKPNDANEKPLRMRHLIVLHEGIVYEIMAMGLESSHVKYDPIFQGIISSLKWTPPTVAAPAAKQ